MTNTLYDIIDSWTLKWDRGQIETTLKQAAAPFHKRKIVFFLLEEIWDILELIDDPLEFMTEDRKIKHIERLLSREKIERVAKSVEIEHSASPDFQITVLNADDLITQHPGWFEMHDGVSWDDVVSAIRGTQDKE